ncbi:scavenger receptor class B member 1 [Episyrphus balteatus]|uniref:scavenger receptor class B member 1 n=1 Tax=Episyrphus balteatus TaxID=286459 RepID=UPI002485B463|nr:scavenger receptor class B member 1 [Episyrphus balteatus]
MSKKEELPPTYECATASTTNNRKPSDSATTIECGAVIMDDVQKEPQKFMEPVYKFVGIKKQPSTKELGTLILLGTMLLLFMISVTGFFVMWFTQYYDNSYVSKLILANNSAAAKYWVDPPVDTYLKVHIFNYTNIDRYLSGEDAKIKVEDLGPYTYQEHSTKTNVKFNANNTVTYNDHHSYIFLPDKSVGDRFQNVIVPNIPLLSASVSVDKMSFFQKFTASHAINALNLDAFLEVPIDDFIWGYSDKLINVLRNFMPELRPKFGMLMNRNGTSPDTLQIHTGVDDVQKLGVISQFNGMDQLNFWRDDECNRIDGSDGSQFPPYLMEERKPLHVFTQALCRKLPLHFEEEVTILKEIDVWRYRTPMNVFANPDDNPENACYCDASSVKCLPSGIFNGTQCYQAPIYPSFPHFFSGDPVLFEEFEGIEPNAEKHRTFADIHPRLAFPVDGASRIQINIAVHKGQILERKLKQMPDGLMLPVLWIEITSGELSEELRTLLYHSTFSANVIQIILKYGTLLTCVTSFALIVLGFYYLGQMRQEKLQADSKDKSELEELNKD